MRLFIFYFLGFTCFTHDSLFIFYFLFFILKRSCISTWLLIWEKNVEVEKKKQFSDKKKKEYVCEEKKIVLFFIFFQKEKIVLVFSTIVLDN